MDQVLDLFVSPRVPVWLIGLFDAQLLKRSFQTQAELVAHDRVSLDGGAVR